MRSASMTACLAILWATLAHGALAQAGHNRARPVTPQQAPTAAPGGYAWFVRGELLMRRGEYAQAAIAFDQVRGQSGPRSGSAMAVTAHALRLGGPEDPLLLARIAEALELAREPTAADLALAEAQAAKPAHLEIDLAHARIAARRKLPGEAIAILGRAAAREPLSAAASHALASQLRASGHLERAGGVLREFSGRRRERGQPPSAAALEAAVAIGSTQNLAEAIRDALTAAAGQRRVLQNAARRLLDAGRPLVAIEALKAMGTDDTDPGLMLRALLAAEKPAAAEAWLATHPAGSLGGMLTAADAYLQLGRPGRARELCELALSSDPGDARARVLSARVGLALGDSAAAALEAASVAGPSAEQTEARRLVAIALASGGLPALAAEVVAQ